MCGTCGHAQYGSAFCNHPAPKGPNTSENWKYYQCSSSARVKSPTDSLCSAAHQLMPSASETCNSISVGEGMASYGVWEKSDALGPHVTSNAAGLRRFRHWSCLHKGPFSGLCRRHVHLRHGKAGSGGGHAQGLTRLSRMKGGGPC